MSRSDELTVGLAFILSSALPVALALLWRGMMVYLCCPVCNRKVYSDWYEQYLSKKANVPQ